MNLPPSKAGVIGAREGAAAAALGAEVQRRYGCGHARPCSPAAHGAALVPQGGSLVLQLPPSTGFNRVWLSEDAAVDGQLVPPPTPRSVALARAHSGRACALAHRACSSARVRSTHELYGRGHPRTNDAV